MSADARRPRVLLGNLEPMTRLGMTEVLADRGLEVVSDDARPTAIVSEARRLAPDVVVLGRAEGGTRDLSAEVRAAVPSAKVIVWARDETEMQVFEPGSATPRRVDTGIRDALLSELGAVQATRERE